MLRSIAFIGFIVCISTVIPVSCTSTPSNAVMALLCPCHVRLCLPLAQATQLVTEQHFLWTSMPHLTMTSKYRLCRHSVIDRVDSVESAAPSSSTDHINLSWATGGKLLVNASDLAAIRSAVAMLLSSNVQFLASMNRIYMFLVPPRSSVLVSAAVASIFSGSSNAVFGAPPLQMWFKCAVVNTRILRQLFSGHQGSTKLQLQRAHITCKSLSPSMYLTSALCNTPTPLLVRLRNDALVSASPQILVPASPQMMVYMTGSTGAFLFFYHYIYPSYLRQLNRALTSKAHRVLLWALSFSSAALRSVLLASRSC